MASVDTNTQNQNDPNNPNNPQGPNQPQTNQQTNQPATSGGAGAVTTTGAGNVTGQVVGTANPSQPFQNIASYLQANAPQSATLANQVASSVSQPIQQTASDIANSSQNFVNSVNTGYTPENSGLISSVASNPVSVVANPNDVTAFQQQLNDTYTGPTDITQTPNYANLESEISNAQSLGQNALSPTGIQTLLQGVEGPQATAGINNLDSLLLNQNPQNFQTIEEAGLPANTTNNALGNFLTTQTTQDNADAQAALAAAQAASTGASGALNTAAGNVASPVAATYQSDISGTQAYDQQLNNLISLISSGNIASLTPAQQSEIGLNPQILTALSEYPGIFPSVAANNMPNPATYYTAPNAATIPPSESAVETPDQAATVAALLQLNGGNPLASLSGLSGTAPTTPYSVPTDFGSYSNTGLADFLYNAYDPMYQQYQQIPPGTNTSGPTAQQINDFMTLLANLANQSVPQPTPVGTGGGGGGPPFLGPPGGGGDVH